MLVFIDDILIITTRTKEEHSQKVRELLKTLDDANMLLKVWKCQTAKQKLEWLGYKPSESGIIPMNTKVQGITERLRPNNSKN